MQIPQVTALTPRCAEPALPGTWKLAAGRAITLEPRDPGLLKVAHGRASAARACRTKSACARAMARCPERHPIIAGVARPKSSEHELRRDEILDVAAQCFADKSYHAASMNDIAAACGTSKARLYHYYESKEAILYDLLDRYTQRLLSVIGQVEATAQRRNLDDRAALHELVRSFLEEYEHSATRHAALLHDTKFLSDAQREVIIDRQ